MSLQNNEVLIDDDDAKAAWPLVNGEVKGTGAVPRDYSLFPAEMFEPPTAMPLIPKSEWSARIKEMEEQQSRISDILLANGIPSMDQGSVGYCWGHSTVGCIQAVRAINNQPYIPLSAYMVCAIIKGGKDQGGWSGLSAKFIREVGVCSQSMWPQGDRNVNRDTPAVRANAALHQIDEEWCDLTRSVYEQSLTFEQLMTCLMSRTPCAVDMSWWSHAIMAVDPVEVEPGSFGIRIRNSWSDSWGDKGFGVLRGSKAIPSGALAIRVTPATPV